MDREQMHRYIPKHNEYFDECQAITGAVVDGDYRCYYPKGGYFTPDGTILDNQENGHPLFELALDEKIQLEFQGSLDIERTVEEYIVYLSASTPHFNNG